MGAPSIRRFLLNGWETITRFEGRISNYPLKRKLPRVKPDMRVTVAGLELANPIVAASGTFGYGIEFEEIVALDRIGALGHQGHFSGADGR